MQGQPRTGFLTSKDSLKLYYEWHAPTERLRGVVVIVHGYADHSGRYQETTPFLVQRGFGVMRFDYRGHGRAEGRRGHCVAFWDFVKDLERACLWALSEADGAPLALLAHSHGALIALHALCAPECPLPPLQAAVFSSPFLGLAMKVPPVKLWISQICGRIVPGLTLASDLDATLISHDPAVVRARQSDPLCHKVATVGWYAQVQAAQAYVMAHIGRLSAPSLWLLAGDDKIVDSAATLRVFEQAGGEKQLRLYDGFYHEVLNETERTRVFHDIETWLLPKFPER